MTLLGVREIILLFLFSLMFDIPRYLLSTFVLALIRPKPLPVDGAMKLSAIVACHNEEAGIRECVESLDVDQIIIVDDGSTDGTWDEVERLQAEGKAQTIVHLARRGSKPAAVNEGLRCVVYPAVLILDSDTATIDPSSARKAARYLAADPKCGGVSLNLRVRNIWASLTTRFQAIEYLVSISFGKRITDALGIMSNVSGAAGVFRTEALRAVGGMDIEVAEDVAITGKLREAGWEIRFAPEATAATKVPETMHALLMQRLRWDSAAVATWLRKFAWHMNPYSKQFSVSRFITALDVVVFSIFLPIMFPIYVTWLLYHVGVEATIWLLTVIMELLVFVECVVIMLTMPSFALVPYIPYYIVVQLFIMRPARIVFMLAEMVGHLTHRDNYIPKHARSGLS